MTIHIAGSSSGSGTYSIQSLSSSNSASGWNYMVKADATSGNITVTLPSATSTYKGQSIVIKKTDNSSNYILVQGYNSGTETIDGKTIYLYNQYDSIVVVNNGDNSCSLYADNRNSTGNTTSFLSATMTSNQTTSLTVGSPVMFNSASNTIGDKISLNTSTYTFTLKAGSKYKLVATSGWISSSSVANAMFRWKDITNGVYLGSTTQYVGATADVCTTEAYATVSPSTDISVQYQIYNLANLNQIGDIATGRMPYAIIEEVSRQATVINTVDYCLGKPTSVITTASTDIPITALSGNLTVTTPYITLLAGKTYSLSACMGFRGATYANYAWVDNTNTQLPNSTIGQTAGFSSADPLSPTIATAVITPGTDTVVKLRTLTGCSGIVGLDVNASYIAVQQLGSTATTSVPDSLLSSNVATLTGTQILTNKSLSDGTTYIVDDSDNTKKAQFQASGITTGTTRTYTLPDMSGTLGVITDGTASGYFDIGTMRIQWGNANITSCPATVTLPAPFANTSYVPNLTMVSTSITIDYSMAVGTRNTTSFTVYRTFLASGSSTVQNSGNDGYTWIAIGLKP